MASDDSKQQPTGIFGKFWSWYERHYELNLLIATVLFILQLFHLYWLTTDVVAFRLFGARYFAPTPWLQVLLILVDYTEIPALITTSLVYIYELRTSFRWKGALYLLFLNIQWLHLFWITDEFVVHQFGMGNAETVMPMWLAWVAICIDYLELPVIVDTVWRVVLTLRKKSLAAMVRGE